MRYIGPKVRRSRRVGMPLSAKSYRVMQKKSSPPGVRSFRRKQLSPYAERLVEKQRLRYYYNVTESYLQKVYKLASHAKGNTADNILDILDSRLDNIVRSMGLIGSIYHAQQLVGHGKISVNGKRVRISSYQCKVGDVISIKETFRENEHLQTYKALLTCASYLSEKDNGYSVVLLSFNRDDPHAIEVDMQKVIEYFSR
jgi:small subunit ribosomal protein S4